MMEVIGVEHHEHVRIDLVDGGAHGRERARHERVRIRLALAR